MAFKFNIFTGTLDITGAASATTWLNPVNDEPSLPLSDPDGAARVTLDTSVIYVFDSNDSTWHRQLANIGTFSTTPSSTGIIISEVTVGNISTFDLSLTAADATNPGGVSIAAQTFAGDKTFANNVIVTGDLTVNGTTTTINTTNLDVEDANISINVGGNQAAADLNDAGLTVTMTDATDAIIGYDSTLASKFHIGEIGGVSEIADVSSSQIITNKDLGSSTNIITSASADSVTRETGNQQSISIPDTATPESFVLTAFTQTLTNKSIDADANTINNIDDADIKAGAAIDASKIANGTVDNTEFEALDGVTSSIQTQLDNKQPLDSTLSALAAYDTNGILTQTATDTFAGRSIVDAGSSRITVTNGDGVAGNPTLDVNEAAVDHDALLNFVADEHVAHTSVEIATAADSGLTGGGDITATRNLSVDIAGTTAETAADNADLLLIYDDSAAALRSMTRSNLLGPSTPSPGDLSETTFSVAQSQTSQDVTGLAFANGVTRSAKVEYSVIIDATADLFEKGTLELIQRGADWVISREFTGDDTLIDFDISAAGQVLYTTPAYAGFASGTMKFRAITTGV